MTFQPLRDPCRFASVRWFAAAATIVITLSVAQSLCAAAFQQASPSSSANPSIQQELIRETRQAAGEDANSQFKQSPSVQWVAKLTGLSLEHSYWLCVGLNFLVVALVIIWLSKKYLPVIFRNRTASIRKAMEEARKASEEANRRLAGIEARLSRLDAELGEMRAAAEKEAAAEEQRIKAAAEEDARKIAETASQEIAAAARAARRELTSFAVDLAVSLAQKQIQVDPAADRRLIHTFAQQLQANGSDGKGGN
jgi:F-type H+-transporting ATPase subunit b